MTNVEFKSPLDFKDGIIVSLLERSYAEIISTNPEYWNQEKEKWAEFDTAVFQNPNTMGACVILTIADDQLIGFGSYVDTKCLNSGLSVITAYFPSFGAGALVSAR